MKKHYPREKKYFNFKYFILGIILFVVLFFLFLLRDDIFGKQFFSDGGRYNLILDLNPLLLLSLDPSGNGDAAVFIPNETYVNVPFGYGPYKAGSVYPLGDLDPDRGGGYLLTQTIQDEFGLPVEGYLKWLYKKPLKLNTSDDLIYFKNTFFNFVSLFGKINQIKTNLSILQLFRLYLILINTRGDQFKFYNLDRYNILGDVKLADGSTASQIDPDRLDKTLEGVFSEAEILKENISISVLNGTSQTGIGSKVARIISNMGGRVVNIGNSDQKLAIRCTIAGKNNLNQSITFRRIKQIFKCQNSENLNLNSQSDLTVTFGEAYLR